MANTDLVKFYPPQEERVNILSHAFATILSIIGLSFLFLKGISTASLVVIVSFTLYGLSLVTLYTISTLYHASKDIHKRARLKVMDHAAIYVLIAGTYTPFTLITLEGKTGGILFAIIWSMAAFGIFLKLHFTGRFKLLSTSMYVVMGWLIIFAIEPMSKNIPETGLFWLIAGGVAYTVGALLYSIKVIPYNHAIFHCFVIIGSACHFWTVYGYVL